MPVYIIGIHIDELEVGRCKWNKSIEQAEGGWKRTLHALSMYDSFPCMKFIDCGYKKNYYALRINGG